MWFIKFTSIIKKTSTKRNIKVKKENGEEIVAQKIKILRWIIINVKVIINWWQKTKFNNHINKYK